MAVIGIDLGTTNSLAAVWRDGRCTLVPGALGGVLTPSVVSVAEDGSILVGEAARERLVAHPQRTASNFKQFMGTEKEYNLGGRVFHPEDLSSFVLRALKADAEAYLGEEVTEAIISVPAYFNDTQRAATKIAGRLAGLHVERIINEPSAAALCYQNEMENDAACLVFDFGGGTLDISVAELFENIVDITAVAGDNHLGGSDIDAAILDAFLEQNPALRDALSPAERASLLKTAEQCKMALSAAPATLMMYQRGSEKYSMELNGAKLMDICSPVLVRIREVLQRALRDAGRGIPTIDEVILVGGSSRMPMVRQYLEFLTGKKPLSDIDPDLAVAVGAGIMAGIKARDGDIRDMVLTDICPFSLGVSTTQRDATGDVFSPIITRNSALPVSRQQRYNSVEDMQPMVAIEIYQGESFHPEQNLYLGKIEMPVPPLPAGEAAVDVRFTYDINGILDVDVRCVQTGDTAHKLIVSNKSLSAGEVEKRVAQLAALKVSPREQAENSLLIAKAERMYQEHTGPLRDHIGQMLQGYLSLVDRAESPAVAGKMRHRLEELLRRVDSFDDGLMNTAWDFGTDDELEE